jgi:hypothetical protein
VIPSSTPLSGPATVEANAARRRHHVVTYKQRRSLRLHPSEDENKLTLRTRQITRNTSSQTSTPSCSPSPAHAAPKSRKRRRRLPPLKNRLARVGRSHLTRQKSQERLSQTPVAVPMELDEEDAQPAVSEAPLLVPESNVAQRRLAAPQNYAIPDLKELLSTKSQAHPNIPSDRPAIEAQRNPLPQFVLPAANNLHAPRPRSEPKRGRPGRKDMPRLNFVALEAHQVQVTARPSDRRQVFLLARKFTLNNMFALWYDQNWPNDRGATAASCSSTLACTCGKQSICARPRSYSVNSTLRPS